MAPTPITSARARPLAPRCKWQACLAAHGSSSKPLRSCARSDHHPPRKIMAKAEKPTALSTFDTALLGAGADDALNALERAGERAEALVDAWVKAGNAAAVGVAADQAGGKARKAAR